MIHHSASEKVVDGINLASRAGMRIPGEVARESAMMSPTIPI